LKILLKISIKKIINLKVKKKKKELYHIINYVLKKI